MTDDIRSLRVYRIDRLRSAITPNDFNGDVKVHKGYLSSQQRVCMKGLPCLDIE